MRLGALIALALIATGGMNEMAPAQASHPAVRVADDGTASGSVELPLGHELQVELGANPTTGYTWRLDTGGSPRLRLKSREYRHRAAPGGQARLGAGGIDRFVFEATAPGSERLHFEYRRGASAGPARTYDLTVTIVP